MKQKLDALYRQIKERIAKHALEPEGTGHGMDTIARLVSAATRIDAMRKQLTEIEQQSSEIDRLLNGRDKMNEVQNGSAVQHPPDATGSAAFRSGRKKIRITIDWSLLAKGNEIEEICEHKASDSLVRFVTRLYQKIGPEVLDKLLHYRINRGTMVSFNPNRDYWNRSDRRPYQHQQIMQTGAAVLTHSATHEKVSDIEGACRHLGFPAGAVKVEAIDKAEGIDYSTLV
jgi:hypothetical protein